MFQSRQVLTDQDNDTSKQIEKTLDSQDALTMKMQKRINEKIFLKSKPKNPVQMNLIMNTLRNHFIFYNLSELELQNIKEKMVFTEVKAGDFIFREEDKGTCFFIIQNGLVELLVNDQFKKQLKAPEGFGEIALLYDTERISTARVKEDCQLWVIDRDAFREAVQEIILKDYQENRKILESVQLFVGLENQMKDKIASICVEKIYYKNQTIIKQGDPGSCFFFIKSGEASAYKGSKFLKKLVRGDYFGQQSLFYNTMRQLTIKADEDTTVLIVGRDTLNKNVGNKIYDVTFKNFIRIAFQNNRILDKLKKKDAEKLIEHMKVSSYKQNETIFRRGVNGFQKMVVVIEGQLKNERNGGIVAIKGECYGEQNIFEDSQNRIMNDEIVMNCYGVIAEITNYEVIRSLKLTKNSLPAATEKAISFSSYENQKKRELANLNLKKLQYVKEISSSVLGEVLLVRGKKSEYYCMRSYRKSLLMKYQVSKYIINEARVLSSLSHPFIVAIDHPVQTSEAVYHVAQYLEGEDFVNVSEKLGLFSTQDAQFYVANILLILQYLAQHCVIARDLKPESFRVDNKGFLKLMNLYVCKQTNSHKKTLAKTFTIIGTPHYMAPDIILGKGYNNMVDLWSLGIMAYQMICGDVPFGSDTDRTFDIYESIMHDELKFPEFITDRKAVRFISQLLNHNPETRLNKSFNNLRTNPWLQKINFLDLLNYKSNLPIPYKPSNTLTDIRNFNNHQGRDLMKYIRESNESMKKDKLPQMRMAESQTQINWEQFGEYIK